METTRPLHRWLALQFALVASVPLATVALLVWLFLLPQIRTDIGIRHQTLARAIAGQVSVHLIDAERELCAVASYIDKYRHRPDSWFDLLDAHAGNGDVYEAIYIAGNNDAVYTVGLPRSRWGRREDLLGLDLSGRAFLSAARIQNKVVWSETFLSTVSGRLAVALAIPMTDQVIIGEITTDRLSEFISHLPVESGLITMILDRQGRIIADSQQSLGGQQLSPHILHIISSEQGGQSATRKFELQGKALIGTIVDVEQLGWKVLVAQSYHKAFRPITFTLGMIGAGLAISLMLAFVGGWLQARGFSIQFSRYTEQARAIAHGDYDRPWPESRLREFSDLAGNLQHMAYAIREREKELLASEEKYRTLFETMTQGVVYVDDAGQITSVNPASEKILGVSINQMVGRTLEDFDWKAVHEDGTEFPFETMPVMVALRTGQAVQNVGMGIFNPRTEAYTWININATPQFNPGHSRPYQVYATFEDITTRKQAEEALRKYERIVSTSKDLMALVSCDYVYEAANDSMLAAQNKPREEVVGHTVSEVIGERAFREKIQPRLDQAFTGQTVYYRDSFDFAGLGRSIMDVTYFPMFDETGKVEGVVLNARDITETQKLEEQLMQSQKIESIGTLAGGVAHEINNPINGIMNYAQLIIDGMEKENPASEFAKEIINETERIAEIVRNLLTFARHEKQSHSPAQFSDIVTSVLSLIQTVMRRDQIDLNVEIPEDLPKIKCRSQQIQQVLMNLMTNARDALNERYPGYDPEKRLRVSARPMHKAGRKFIRTTVEDFGTGISPEIRKRIFDPFFTSKPKESGTGLGLSISYGIVKDHGGELTVESEPGRYTRFHMDLPMDNGWKL